MNDSKSKRICDKGHVYYKTSDCPTCPVCANESKPSSGFLSKLSGPARSALLHDGIDTLDKLAQYSEKEILKLHGIGKASLPTMKALLNEKGLDFKKVVK